MKKTLFTLALLGALNLAMGQDTDDTPPTDSLQDSVSLTFSNTANTSAGHVSTCYGMAFTLSNNLDTARVTTTAAIGDTPLTQIPTLFAMELQSITLKVYGDNWNNYSTYAYIADSVTKTVVAHSSNSVSGSGGDSLTFDFSNVTLSSDTTYLLIFMNDAANNSRPEIGQSALASNGNIWANKRGLSTVGNSLDTATSPQLGFINDKGAISGTAYSPVVTIRATATLPEPTTATLTLLALAGLAARRRR